MSEYYYIEYGALQANGKRLIECETSALEAKKITEDFAREIADALNGREALKQEKAEIEANALAVGGIVEASRHKPSSNAAAMREALENSNGLLEELAVIGEWGESAREQIAENNAALFAPARNYDRFADELDAQLAFLNEVWLISVDRETMLERDKYENWSDEMRTRYGKWLLAPAAERKGEYNGK